MEYNFYLKKNPDIFKFQYREDIFSKMKSSYLFKENN
jgi:hypothetical protein